MSIMQDYDYVILNIYYQLFAELVRLKNLSMKSMKCLLIYTISKPIMADVFFT